ncbi:MAG: four helix bundle protein [Brevundimonas sp.]|uniref:four helix bundle protein n=1 Tax=Brevundimonas sp. TaxID=1871086 RepID=UPI00179188BD|nr:four helix bundle protein [Brevundimonas sp.]MBA4805458.1 four helix bundle protein [Brevundimonas sp.]
MSGVQSYRDLLVWQRAMDIAAATYELSRLYPKDELFGLTSQSRRAAASIAANIAEGHGRTNRSTFAHFLRIAQGSLKELETHLLLAERVGVAPPQSTGALLASTDELGRMLRALIVKVQKRPVDLSSPNS